MNEMLGLSLKEQESVLGSLEDNYLPIQIDKDVFLIPMPVHELIDDMYKELNVLRKSKKRTAVGAEEDKR
tara:strand:+ start:310 stop:519 length:210 start_codon:yes stop_codon:yes gene_type:complete